VVSNEAKKFGRSKSKIGEDSRGYQNLFVPHISKTGRQMRNIISGFETALERTSVG